MLSHRQPSHIDCANVQHGQMDTLNLETASQYINHLLLSRGLLRNGKSIDFIVRPDDEAQSQSTSADIINLVHDLILRRDVGILRRYIHFMFSA